MNPGLWERFSHGHLLGEYISKDLIYNAFKELAISLYPEGPEQRNIWERAGGYTGKLYNAKSREENWKYAVDLLKNGGGGEAISLKKLVKEMLEDFPGNAQLKELKKYDY